MLNTKSLLHPMHVYHANVGCLNHCDEAQNWLANQPNFKKAWFSCTNPHWMWWIVDDLCYEYTQTLDPRYFEALNAARKTAEKRDCTGPEICDAIRKVVPYIVVIRAFMRFVRKFDEEHPL